MCGIAGIISFDSQPNGDLASISTAVNALAKRGPDGEGTFTYGPVALGHRRLAIIDTSAAGAQPFTETTGRYTIVFNGEFFNYLTHRLQLEKEGIVFNSHTDTEVLLQLFIKHGPACLGMINGFFAFAIYDKEENALFIARDRFGIKPLFIYQDEKKFCFASSIASICSFGISTALDLNSLYAYLQLNYIPFSGSIFERIYRLTPGNFIWVRKNEITTHSYYAIPKLSSYPNLATYPELKLQLHTLLEEAVVKRLVADVPLGCFLSGGIDSSIITAIAAKHVPNLKTFSIGYKDDPFFDETAFAQLVADKCGTDHTVFALTNADLIAHLFEFLDVLDEPFADSSALAVYILSKKTKAHVTVALSGDGADEIFAGYNKHEAELKLRNNRFLNGLLKKTDGLWQLLPQSRNSFIGNKIRQINKLSHGANQLMGDRYWNWAGYASEGEIDKLLLKDFDKSYYKQQKNLFLKKLNSDFNSVLLADMEMVLEGDMLVKVDRMSMANGLEVRVPFLDYNVVNFGFSLPSIYKIDGNVRKKILKETFHHELPAALMHRGKKGFEVPLLRWFQNELKPLIVDDLLSQKFVRKQGLFDPQAIQSLLATCFSNNPGDSPARIWGLIVFQYWWKKHYSE